MHVNTLTFEFIVEGNLSQTCEWAIEYKYSKCYIWGDFKSVNFVWNGCVEKLCLMNQLEGCYVSRGQILRTFGCSLVCCECLRTLASNTGTRGFFCEKKKPCLLWKVLRILIYRYQEILIVSFKTRLRDSSCWSNENVSVI